MKTEFELIEQIRRRAKINYPHSKIQIGIGDDCAVISQNRRTDLVITTDLIVEDIDFRLKWTSPQFIGEKALAISLSDVAAMGAKPIWGLVSIGIPTEIWRSGFVEKFYQGWFKLAKKFNVELAGGDVSRTTDKIVIDSIIAGEVKKGCAVLRSGANVGDLIYVTGELGGAAAGLNLLGKGWQFDYKKQNAMQNLLRRQLIPIAQVKSGELLGKKRLATAMIDLSDGLASDLNHLCRASGVGAKIFADKIPIQRELKTHQTLLATSEFDAFSLAMSGGEDFELLFTVKPKNAKKIEKSFSNVSCIGEITGKANKIELVSQFEKRFIEPKGFQHF